MSSRGPSRSRLGLGGWEGVGRGYWTDVASVNSSSSTPWLCDLRQNDFNASDPQVPYL